MHKRKREAPKKLDRLPPDAWHLVCQFVGSARCNTLKEAEFFLKFLPSVEIQLDGGSKRICDWKPTDPELERLAPNLYKLALDSVAWTRQSIFVPRNMSRFSGLTQLSLNYAKLTNTGFCTIAGVMNASPHFTTLCVREKACVRVGKLASERMCEAIRLSKSLRNLHFHGVALSCDILEETLRKHTLEHVHVRNVTCPFTRRTPFALLSNMLTQSPALRSFHMLDMYLSKQTLTKLNTAIACSTQLTSATVSVSSVEALESFVASLEQNKDSRLVSITLHGLELRRAGPQTHHRLANTLRALGNIVRGRRTIRTLVIDSFKNVNQYMQAWSGFLTTIAKRAEPMRCIRFVRTPFTMLPMDYSGLSSVLSSIQFTHALEFHYETRERLSEVEIMNILLSRAKSNNKVLLFNATVRSEKVRREYAKRFLLEKIDRANLPYLDIC